MSLRQKTKNIFLILFYLVKHPRKFYAALSVRGKKWALRGLILLLIILIAVPTAFWYQARHAKAAWWNESWMYRQKIQLSNSTGADLTDFQVSTTVDTASLITAGKMQDTTCADMRFTDSKGQPLDYWIEENNPGCNNAATKVWLKAPKVYSGTNATSIYMYYGNPSATATQDGNKVFEFFDDFNGSSIDTKKWNTSGVTGYALNAGNLEVTYNDGGGGNLLTTANQLPNNSFVAQYKVSDALDIRLNIYASQSPIKRAAGGGNWYMHLVPWNNTDSRIDWFSNGSVQADKVITGSPKYTDYAGALKVSYSSASQQYVTLDTSSGQVLNNVSLSKYSVSANYLSVSRDGSGTPKVDYIAIHKYASADPTTSASAEEIGPGPVAYWKFDDPASTPPGGTAGQATKDSTVNGNDGVLGSTVNADSADPTWKPESDCVAGKCLSFDGGDDYIDTNSAGLGLQTTNTITVSAWIKPQGQSGDLGHIISDYNRSTPKGWSLNMITDNTVSATNYEAMGNQRQRYSSPLALNKWYHVEAVIYPNNTLPDIYIDGKLNNATDLTQGNVTQLNQGSTNVIIGRQSNYSPQERYFKGFIDEPKIYPYARTASQIQQDYNAGLAGMATNEGANVTVGESPKWMTDGLVGHWKMDEASGTTVADASGNGNTGTLTSAQETGTAQTGSSTAAATDPANGALSSTDDAYNNMIFRITGGTCGITSGTERTITDYTGSSKTLAFAAFSATTEGCTFEVRHQTGGKFGNGMGFEGSNDHVSLANEIMPGTSNFTASAWFNLSSMEASSDKIESIFGNNQNTPFLGYRPNAKRFYAYRQWISDSEIIASSVTTNNLADSSWHHIVMTTDQEKFIVKFYLDGNFLSSAPIGTEGYTVSNGAFKRIGYSYLSSDLTQWRGRLDDLRYYNRALSPDEVSQLSQWGPGPVGQWKMDEGSGGTVSDSSGNGNNGSWGGTGLKWANGKFGNAGNFSGTNDYIQVGDPDILKLKQTGSMEMWVNPNAYPTCASGSYCWKIIANKGNWGGGYNSYNIYYQKDSSDNVVLRFEVDGYGGNRGISLSNTKTLLNTWTHLALTWDGTTITAYVNGIREGTQTMLGFPVTDGMNLLFGDPSQHFVGLLDDVRIYNYARTPAQIQQDMAGGIAAAESGGGPLPDPVAHWKMDEGQGGTAQDSSVNNNDGTLYPVGGTNDTTAKMWDNGGKFGKAMEFDGTDDYVEVANNTSLQFNSGSSITLSAWVYPRDNNGYRTFVTKGRYSDTYNTNYSVRQNGKKLELYYNDSGSNTWQIWTTTDDIFNTTSAWYHISITYTFGSGSSIKSYINGQDKSGSWTTGSGNVAPDVDTQPLTIGSEKNQGEYFNGLIDEVKIYNSALSPEQVKLDMNQGKALQLGGQTSATGAMGQAAEYCVPGDTASCAGPVGEWKFDEGSGGSVNDTSGNGNNGSWSGTGTRWTVDGKYNNAGSFNGSDDYANISDSGTSSLDLGSSGTIEVWAKSDRAWPSDDATSAYRGWVDKEQSGGPSLDNSYSFHWYGNDTTSKLRLARSDGSTNIADDYAIGALTVGRWYNFSVSWNTSNVFWYVDGKLVETDTQSFTATNGNASVHIGGRAFNNLSPPMMWDGTMDNAKVFNYVRTPAQIAWDYNRGKPVGWWKMDDDVLGDARTLYDYSGNGKNATAYWGANSTGMDCTVQGKFGGGCNFDGTDDYAQVADQGASDSFRFGQNSFSWGGWVKTTDSTADLIGKTFTTGGAYTMITSGGTLRVYVIDTSGTYCVNAADTGKSIVDNSWHHIFTVVDRTSNLSKTYLDGNMVLSTGLGSCGGVSPAANLYFGRYSGGNYMQGSLDDVRIYNYALTADQVKQVMNEGSAIRFGE